MKMRIGGEWMDAAGGAGIEVTNPATGEAIDRVPSGDRRDVEAGGGAAAAPNPAAGPPPRQRGS
jgi:acyl-CoA reductase-like NAD-dependent aldehyde dehydrogenase